LHSGALCLAFVKHRRRRRAVPRASEQDAPDEIDSDLQVVYKPIVRVRGKRHDMSAAARGDCRSGSACPPGHESRVPKQQRSAKTKVPLNPA